MHRDVGSAMVAASGASASGTRAGYPSPPCGVATRRGAVLPEGAHKDGVPRHFERMHLAGAAVREVRCCLHDSRR